MPHVCVFCQNVTDAAPAHILAEDDRTIAFLDRGPATEGHTLVPRIHDADIWEISSDDAAALMRMAKRVGEQPHKHQSLG